MKHLTTVGAVVVGLLLSACGSQDKSESNSTGALDSSLVEANDPAPSKPQSDNLEATVNAYMEELESMSSLFAKIVDENTAKRHGPDVRKASERLKGYMAQLESVDSAQRGKAFAAQAQRFMQIQATMMPEIGRISQDPTLSRHIGDSIRIPSFK